MCNRATQMQGTNFQILERTFLFWITWPFARIWLVLLPEPRSRNGKGGSQLKDGAYNEDDLAFQFFYLGLPYVQNN